MALAELLNQPPVLAISGVLWSTVRSAADNSWQAICWSPELGLYACVAGSGTGNRVNDLKRWHPLECPTCRQPIRTGWRSAGLRSWGCSSPSATAALGIG
jgi:hypothetical protein